MRIDSDESSPDTPLSASPISPSGEGAVRSVFPVLIISCLIEKYNRIDRTINPNFFRKHVPLFSVFSLYDVCAIIGAKMRSEPSKKRRSSLLFCASDNRCGAGAGLARRCADVRKQDGSVRHAAGQHRSARGQRRAAERQRRPSGGPERNVRGAFPDPGRL